MRPPATVAVVRVSERADPLVDRLIKAIPGSYVPDGPTVGERLARAFEEAEGIVFVGAAGIAIRLAAPLLRSKTTDPGIVVVDEAARFAISLVGGHLGGANSLAGRVATAVGAQAVVTTASDLRGLPAFDLLARELGYDLPSLAGAKEATSALLDGRIVVVVCDSEEMERLEAALAGTSAVIIDAAEDGALPTGTAAVVLVSDRSISFSEELPLLRLRPRRLRAGVGCKRGVSFNEVLGALRETCVECGFAVEALGSLATIDLKMDEPGLREAASALGLPLIAVSAEKLRAVDVPNPSARVHELLGVESVAEAAALVEGGELVAQKSVKGRVVVAVARC